MRIYYYTDQPLDISKYTKEEIEKCLKKKRNVQKIIILGKIHQK